MGPNNGNNGAVNFNQQPNPQAANFNVAPNQLPQYNVGPNTTFNSGYEQMNQAPAAAETTPSVVQSVQPAQAIPVAAPVVTPVITPVSTTPADKTKTPAQLEKEWVDKTKSAIDATRSDPYEQAHQIALLMKGYLQARYGKIVGK